MFLLGRAFHSIPFYGDKNTTKKDQFSVDNVHKLERAFCVFDILTV